MEKSTPVLPDSPPKLKKITYFGINLTFNEDKIVTIDMKEYVRGVIAVSGEDVSRNAATPAKRGFFMPTKHHLHWKKKSQIFFIIILRNYYT